MPAQIPAKGYLSTKFRNLILNIPTAYFEEGSLYNGPYTKQDIQNLRAFNKHPDIQDGSKIVVVKSDGNIFWLDKQSKAELNKARRESNLKPVL